MTPSFTPQQLHRLANAIWCGYEDLCDSPTATSADFNERCCQFIREMESAAELHVFISNYNWDDGEVPIHEVLKHPHCDRGTALFIYWLAADVFTAGRPTEHPEYSLALEIERRMLSDGFPSAQIRYDPSEHEHFVVKVKAVHPLPEIMTVPTPGEPLDFDVHELDDYGNPSKDDGPHWSS